MTNTLIEITIFTLIGVGFVLLHVLMHGCYTL